VAYAAVLWTAGVACLLVAVLGKRVRIGPVQLPAAEGRARVSMASIGLLALVLGSLLFSQVHASSPQAGGSAPSPGSPLPSGSSSNSEPPGPVLPSSLPPSGIRWRGSVTITLAGVELDAEPPKQGTGPGGSTRLRMIRALFSSLTGAELTPRFGPVPVHQRILNAMTGHRPILSAHLLCTMVHSCVFIHPWAIQLMLRLRILITKAPQGRRENRNMERLALLLNKSHGRSQFASADTIQPPSGHRGS
jgi:hypothetical protein